MTALATGTDAIPALILLVGSAWCFYVAWKAGSL